MTPHVLNSEKMHLEEGGTSRVRTSRFLLAAIVLALLLLLTVLLGCKPHSPAVPPASVSASPTPSSRPYRPVAAEDVSDIRRDEQGRLVWPLPRTEQRRLERERMVREDIGVGASFRDGVKDERVLAAMRAVPRHEFVPNAWQVRAYDDSPLPIGHEQTISQPYIVALMTELLDVKEGNKVLEIGTGSGYQAAVLNELTPYVYTIEYVQPLCEEARERFTRLGYSTIRVKCGDGYEGWEEYAPFDGVIVTCAAERVPTPLWEQLAPGGRMVIPVGGEHDVQQLIVLTKNSDGSRSRRDVIPVRFVPMTGKVREP